MSDSTIDEAILSFVGLHWRKVAIVIATVADKKNGDLPQGDDSYQVVARRIEALADDGRLEAQGNIENWRFSEVRRPNLDAT